MRAWTKWTGDQTNYINKSNRIFPGDASKFSLPDRTHARGDPESLLPIARSTAATTIWPDRGYKNSVIISVTVSWRQTNDQ